MRNLITLGAALCFVALPATAQVEGAGSTTLPTFDSGQAAKQALDGLKDLAPLGEFFAEAEGRLRPLVQAYNEKPSLESREALESEMATLMRKLSGDVSRVAGKREKVKFAFQDIRRKSRVMQEALTQTVGDFEQRTSDEDTQVGTAQRALEDAAAAAQDASEEEKASAMRNFKAAYRAYRHAALRKQRLQIAVRNFSNLLSGVRALNGNFEGAHDRIDDVFAELEDISDYLTSEAGIRTMMAETLRNCRVMSGTVGDVLRTTGSIPKLMGILESLTSYMDDGANFAGVIDDIGQQLEPFGNGEPGKLVDWDSRLNGVLSGDLFEKKNPTTKIEGN